MRHGREAWAVGGWARVLAIALLIAPLAAVSARQPVQDVASIGTVSEPSPLGLNSAAPEMPAARIDAAVRLASEDPARARAALAALSEAWPPAEGWEDARARLLWRAELQVSVESRDAERLAQALAAVAAGGAAVDVSTPAAAADLALMQAQLAELRNQPAEAAERAREALAFHQSTCPLPAALRADSVLDDAPQARESGHGLGAFPECDYRAVWQAERLLERQALADGLLAQARSMAQARLALVLAAGDRYRSAQTWSLLGFLAAKAGEPDAVVRRLLDEARRTADAVGDPELRIRTLINEAAVAIDKGDARTSIARLRSALALARTAGLQRPQVMLLNNLADSQLRLRQPRQALRTVQEALPLAEKFQEQRVLHALRNNAGLAYIGLGDIEAGKQQMALAEALLGEEGNDGQRVEMLREFGLALAAAGDARGALELYHRERALSSRISRENLDAALREIQASFDAEVRQRDMALLEDQLATRKEEIASQDLTLRIWLLLLALLAVLLLLGALLYGRLRDRERLLSERRERLRRESEQDTLTGLGNRRAFELRMQSLLDMPGAPGALLLLDIDHFKRINDRYGHSSGDAVLVEVARRVQACLRRDDLVVRWGGEEFLAHVSGMGADQALGLGRRILERIASEPVEMPNGSLQVTASMGLCLDLLPSCPAELRWEERLRLADLALYAAKSRGRSRAVAVVDSNGSADALRAPEIDFEAGERSGLLRTQSAVVSV